MNAASLASGPVAPGSLAAAFGSFSLDAAAQSSAVPLPGVLTGLSTRFESGSGIDAPLFYSSGSQVNLQIPWELSGLTSVSTEAMLDGAAGPAQTIKLAPFAPGIFTTNGQG